MIAVACGADNVASYNLEELVMDASSVASEIVDDLAFDSCS